MTCTIVVDGLSKTYGSREALRDVTFDVEAGSIYGLIGPNGAGKTTTLAVLAGLVRRTSGNVRVLGLAVSPDQVSQESRIGFYSPAFDFFDYLTGREILLSCGLLHGVSRTDVVSRAADLLTLLDLEVSADHFVHTYSRGMRQKLGLAGALIHSPEVLLLDEPFEGLDPTSVYRLTQTLRTMADRGRTILITSHDLSLVERISDRVGILHNGVIAHECKPASAGESNSASAPGNLESLLWQVVGKPTYQELSWI